MIYWHGGKPGLMPGDIVTPIPHRVDGCPVCAAKSAGLSPVADPQPKHPEAVYATSDRLYAKFYASKYPEGDLYSIAPICDVHASDEDPCHDLSTRLPARVAAFPEEAVRPEHAKRYPADWKAISRDLRENRAQFQCECVGECGLHKGRRCTERHMEPAQWAEGRVVLTTAHRNHKPEDCRPENLVVMCNRCHLRYDRFFHKVGQLEEAGQERLFDWHPD